MIDVQSAPLHRLLARTPALNPSIVIIFAEEVGETVESPHVTPTDLQSRHNILFAIFII